VLAADEIWRFPAIDSLPQRFKTALISYEDAYFYQHPGINPIAIVKALVGNIKAGKVVRGGSTLTMQLARMADGNQQRTVWQKIKELLMALRYEAQLTKEEILIQYASHAPFGSNIEGLSAASYRYYGRAPNALSWGEAALLAVLPNQPSMIFPGRNTAQLLQKRNRLLQKLFDQGTIDSISYQLAVLEDIPQNQQPFPKECQHLLFQLHQQAAGKRYVTTIEQRLQNRSTEILNQYVQKLAANQIHNASALIIDWKTQEVKAYVGNAQSGVAHDEAVDIIRSVRSPGSLLKPILYAYALHDGLISPKQLLNDIPLFYEGFSPKNFDHQYYGAVQADEALSRSLNIPFVNLLRSYGVAPFYNQIKKMGFESLRQPASHYGLSLILGGAEISPWEVGHLYSQMARSLTYDSSQVDLNILSQGQAIANKKQQLHAGAAFMTLKAMKELQRPGEEFGWERFSGAQSIAWKTGTSFGFRDAWAVGINQRYVVVIWAGNADGEGRPGLVGVRAAAPLLFQLMQLLEDDEEDFHMPIKDLQTAKICSKSGYLAAEACPEVTNTLINKSYKLRTACPFHQIVFLDQQKQLRVNASCYPIHRAVSKAYLVLPPAVSYYYKPHHADFETLPPWQEGCNPMSQEPMELIYPKDLTTLFIPKELDGQEGRAIFELAHQKKEATVYWYVDEAFIGRTSEQHQMEIGSLKAGMHQLYLIDEDANYLKLDFEVVARKQ
jgi:penicillin-binding protein 1C